MDHRLILEWADGHIERLERAFGRFWKEQPNALRRRHDDAAGEEVLTYFPHEIHIAPEWIFHIGDVVHNQRVALDYLAFRIVQKHSPAANEAKTGFPIGYDPARWNELAGRRLGKNMPSPIKDDFERLQPYHAGRDMYAHPLAMLDRLENIHKHRRLVSARPTIAGVYWFPTEKIRPISSSNLAGVILDQPTDLYRYAVVDRSYTDDDVNAYVREEICFAEPGTGVKHPLVINTLNLIRDHIRQAVFPALEDHL